MTQELQRVRVAFVVANEGVEQAELIEPWDTVVASGAQALLAAPKAGPVQLFQHLDRSESRDASLATAELDTDHFDAVVLPRGAANADELRADGPANADELRADGPAVHVVADMLGAGGAEGRTLTPWPSLRTDIHNAGGHWVDEVVPVDRNLVSSRKARRSPGLLQGDRGRLRKKARRTKTR